MMEKLLLLYIFLFYWDFLNALFTVEAPQSLYTAELGNNVTMECTFPVNGKLKFRDLSVSWEKKDKLKKDVYVLLKGEEDFGSQHSDFTGRAKLLKEHLKFGQSLLQISDVKLRDAGLYRCLIVYGGADYKNINLKVQAPYRTIIQEVVSTGDKEWKLTCQSEGYPKAEVMWQNGECKDLTDRANTSYGTGSDQLYRVTSTLTIKNRTHENFRCIFWNKELQENTSAILYIADCSGRFPGHFTRVLKRVCWHPSGTAGGWKQAAESGKDSVDDVQWTESRRLVWAILIVTFLVGSVPVMLCIRKARANKDCRTRMAKTSINTAKPSKDKDTHDCRGRSFEEEELNYLHIAKT